MTSAYYSFLTILKQSDFIFPFSKVKTCFLLRDLGLFFPLLSWMNSSWLTFGCFKIWPYFFFLFLFFGILSTIALCLGLLNQSAGVTNRVCQKWYYITLLFRSWVVMLEVQLFWDCLALRKPRNTESTHALKPAVEVCKSFQPKYHKCDWLTFEPLQLSTIQPYPTWVCKLKF